MAVQRNSFLTDFTLPVCSGHHPDCVFTQQAFGAVGVWNAFWVTEVITAVISLVIYRRAITGP